MVDGIFEVKFGRNRERRVYSDGPYTLLVTPDAFYILKRSASPQSILDIIHKKQFLEEIRLLTSKTFALPVSTKSSENWATLPRNSPFA